MNSFVARTRVRGEIGYCKARWIKLPGCCFIEVLFLEGEHEGERFASPNVAIAEDDKHLLERWQNESFS